jgi:hypothetical protein
MVSQGGIKAFTTVQASRSDLEKVLLAAMAVFANAGLPHGFGCSLAVNLPGEEASFPPMTLARSTSGLPQSDIL